MPTDSTSYFLLFDPNGQPCLRFRDCDLRRTESAPAGELGLAWPNGPSSVRHSKVFEGISLHTALFNFDEPEEYGFVIKDRHVTLSYCLQGQSSSKIELDHASLNQVIQTPANCTASLLPNAHGYWRPKKGLCRLLSLRLSLAVFEQLGRQVNDSSGHGSLPRVDEPFFISAPANQAITMAARGLDQALCQESTMELLVQCKTLELCLLIMAQLHRCNFQEEFKAIPLSLEDEANIHLASEILLGNMSDPPSLCGLARMAGINEFKLKRGFRQVFGMTPFDFLRGARLDKAKLYLEEGRMNVCEACLAVGYSNQGHFCGAFKKRFGVTPGGVRQSVLRRLTGTSVETR